MRHHFTPTRRRARMKKKENNEYPQRHKEIGTLLCWWGWKLVQLLWKTFWQFLKKLNTELPNDSVIPLLGVYPREMKPYVHSKTCT